jgi:hypothetical protein
MPYQVTCISCAYRQDWPTVIGAMVDGRHHIEHHPLCARPILVTPQEPLTLMPSEQRRDRDRAVLIATLITERPLCALCIATRAGATADDVEATFQHIEAVIELRRIEPGRCGACGRVNAVFLTKRPRP